MKKFLFFFSACVLFSYLSCEQEEEDPFKYPKVYTNSVNTITTDGARFNGKVDFSQMDQITEFGFIWGKDSELTKNTLILPIDTLIGNAFYADIRSSIIAQEFYFVRAYVKESGKTVYGNIVSFRSLGSEGPKITGLNPSIAAFGDTIEVIGKNFTSDAILQYNSNQYYYSQNISFSILKTEKNKITFILPDTLNAGYSEGIISVSIQGNIAESPVPLRLDVARMSPKISSVTPLSIKACDTITIHGKNLKLGKRTVYVYSASRNLEVISSTADNVVCILTRVPNTDAPLLTINNGLYSSDYKGDEITKNQPEIISVSPTTYKSKGIVTVKVKNFPYCDNLLYAYIKDYYYGNLSIVSKSKDEIVLQLPQGCLGTITIVLTSTADYYSNAQLFEVPALSPESPEITSIEPSHGSIGDQIIIKGNKLKGASVTMLDTLSTTDTEVKGILNESGMIKENGFVDVTVASCGSTIKTDGFKYDPIQILDFNPKTITSPSQQITITGKNFSSFPSQNMVTIGTHTFGVPSDDHQTITILATELVPDASQSINQSPYITVQNGMGKSTTSSIPLIITHQASWYRLNDFPFVNSIYSGISFSTSGNGYAGSNYGSANFWKYDPTYDSWEEKAAYPGHITGYRVSAATNGKGYVGLDATYNREWWEYDSNTDIWTQKTDYPGSTASGGFAFELGGKIYVGGGGSNLEFWEYNPAGNSWIQKADIPIYSGVATANFGFNSKGYIYGASLDGTQYLEVAYDPGSDTWTTRPIERFQGSSNYICMIFQNYVIIGGGPVSGNGNAFFKVVPGSGNLSIADYGGIARNGPIGFAIGNYGYWGLGLDGSNFYPSTEMWKFDPSKF
jgi:hypothetical protein